MLIACLISWAAKLFDVIFPVWIRGLSLSLSMQIVRWNWHFFSVYRLGYTNKIILISDVITGKGSDLFNILIRDTGHACIM